MEARHANLLSITTPAHYLRAADGIIASSVGHRTEGTSSSERIEFRSAIDWVDRTWFIWKVEWNRRYKLRSRVVSVIRPTVQRWPSLRYRTNFEAGSVIEAVSLLTSGYTIWSTIPRSR